MRRLAVPGLVALAAVALVGLLIFGVLQTEDDSSLDQAVARGEKPAAQSVTLNRLDGSGTDAIANHRGRPIVVNFFASWCPPCEEEAPLLNRVQEQLEAAGGTVIGIAVDDARADTQGFVDDHGVRFPVLRDVDRALSKNFEVKGLPETFVIDEQGRITALQRQQITQRWVDDHVTPLLAQQ